MFSSIEDFKARIDDPALDIDENCVMVLQGAGPKGYPGFPELGNLPLPKKVLKKGITDMVRISDARMSGTAYGAVVLHVSPESAIGGPLALVKDGDMIELDVEKRRLHLGCERARAREAPRDLDAAEAAFRSRLGQALSGACAAGASRLRSRLPHRQERLRRAAAVALSRSSTIP